MGDVISKCRVLIKKRKGKTLLHWKVGCVPSPALTFNLTCKADWSLFMSGVCLCHASSLCTFEVLSVVQCFPCCHTSILFVSWFVFFLPLRKWTLLSCAPQGTYNSKKGRGRWKSGVSIFTEENVCPFNNIKKTHLNSKIVSENWSPNNSSQEV